MSDNNGEIVVFEAMLEVRTMDGDNLLEVETAHSDAAVEVEIDSAPKELVEPRGNEDVEMVEVAAMNSENLIELEPIISEAVAEVDVHTEPVVPVETQNANDFEAIEVDATNCEDLVEEESQATVEVVIGSEPVAIPVVTVESDSDDSDEDELGEEEEEEDEEEEDEYDYYRRRRGYYDYDDYVCKKCKADDSYDYVTIRPEIMTDVPSLSEIAFVSVAATLWNHVNIPKALTAVTAKCAKNSSEWAVLRKEVYGLPKRLPIPKVIAKQIKKRVLDMATKITDWVSYHFRTVYMKNGIDKVVYNHVYHIVWRSNGTIDCEETARSLITSVRLSEVEKFKFLATYCLQDEIEELSPLLFLNNAIEYVYFYDHPLIEYWYRRFRNQLNKIAVTDASLSIDASMFRHNKVDNWPAKEYFFNRLSFDEQVRDAIWLIDKQGSVFQKAVLLKLDETQRLRVFMERGEKIIMNYINPPTSAQFVLSTWLEIRNFITAERCIVIFRRLLDVDVDETLLIDIWLDTPEELKNYLVYSYNFEIIEKVLMRWKRCDESDLIFVVLQELHVDTKKSITSHFSSFFGTLLWSGEPERLNRILEFCLPDAEERLRFKKELFNETSVTNHCENLLLRGEYQKLERILEFCLAELGEKVRFKADFIETTSCMKRCENLLVEDDFKSLNRLLEFVLPNDEIKLRFRRKLFTRTSCTNHCENLLLRSEYQKLDRVLEFCLVELEEKVRFKAGFIKTTSCMNHCENLLTSGDFDRLNRMLEFLLPNVGERVQFRKELFARPFCARHCGSLLLRGEYEKLDRVLEFCLVELEEKIRFRMTSCINCCESLLAKADYQGLNRMLESLLPNIEERIQITRSLTEKPFFVNHCETLLMKDDLKTLDQLLKLCLPKVEEMAQFKQNLIMNSKHIKNTCLNFFSSGDPIRLDTFLKKLLAPYPDLITQYKVNLLRSAEGIRKCVDLFESPTDVVSPIIEHTFADANRAAAYKKSIIMSNVGISKLKRLILGNRLNVVISWYDRYLKTAEDKKNLKRLLIGDMVKQIRIILKNNDESYLQSFLLWCFGNDDAIQQFKQTIALETVFIDLLKESIFIQYDRLLTNCRFRNQFDPQVVDRFLNWFFPSPVHRMQFKMRIIRSFARIEMFSTLLRKSDDSYLRAMVQWFFQKDSVEIARFKSSFRNAKISKFI